MNHQSKAPFAAGPIMPYRIASNVIELCSQERDWGWTLCYPYSSHVDSLLYICNYLNEYIGY